MKLPPSPFLASVHVTPGARHNRVGGQHDGMLRVWVTAPADKGRANQAVLKEMARALQLRAAQLELVSGHSSRRKVVAIATDDPEALRVRLAALAEPPASGKDK